MTPEQLIAHLLDQNSKLQAELTQANADIMDFERAAIEWKKGYEKMEHSYKIKLEHAEQIAKELEEEVVDLKEYRNAN